MHTSLEGALGAVSRVTSCEAEVAPPPAVCAGKLWRRNEADKQKRHHTFSWSTEIGTPVLRFADRETEEADTNLEAFE